MAGSRNVYELHGSIHRNYCIKCGKSYTLKYLIDNNMFDKYADGVPRCSSCMEEISRSTGKQMDCVIKPDVVLYEEGLNDETVSSAVYAISNADLLIIGGTSLNVYPAAGLLRYFEGSREKIVLINKTETAFDIQAGTVFHEGLGEVFSRIRTMPLNK
jgi:NAD-dependent deacetylase